jgi:hypothetical protein
MWGFPGVLMSDTPQQSQSVARPLGLPVWSEAKIRNAVVVLRAYFAKPDGYIDAAWEVHLREVAKLMLDLAVIGRREFTLEQAQAMVDRTYALALNDAAAGITQPWQDSIPRVPDLEEDLKEANTWPT